MSGKPKYQRNQKYFCQPTIQNSYWAGFIAADGYIGIRDGKPSILRVTVKKSDEQHLLALKDDIEYTGPLTSNGECVELGIYSQEIVEDLDFGFNITNAKTFTLHSPTNLSPECRLAFIKGFIDGDGCISTQQKGRYRTISIGCASERFLKWVRKQLQVITPFTARVRKVTNKQFYTIMISGSHADKIYQELKQLPTRCLDRKWKD